MEWGNSRHADAVRKVVVKSVCQKQKMVVHKSMLLISLLCGRVDM